MNKFSILLTFVLAFNSASWAEDVVEPGPSETQQMASSVQTVEVAQEAYGQPAMTAYDDSRNGLFSLPDGSCIQRTVFDHGYTNVTINAQGILAAMKNDVVEDVAVNCP